MKFRRLLWSNEKQKKLHDTTIPIQKVEKLNLNVGRVNILILASVLVMLNFINKRWNTHTVI